MPLKVAQIHYGAVLFHSAEKRMKIYTKTGDTGTTGLLGGGRVTKSSSRITAYGEIDELNALIGIVCAETPHTPIRESLAESRQLYLRSAPSSHHRIPIPK